MQLLPRAMRVRKNSALTHFWNSGRTIGGVPDELSCVVGDTDTRRGPVETSPSHSPATVQPTACRRSSVTAS